MSSSSRSYLVVCGIRQKLRNLPYSPSLRGGLSRALNGLHQGRKGDRENQCTRLPPKSIAPTCSGSCRRAGGMGLGSFGSGRGITLRLRTSTVVVRAGRMCTNTGPGSGGRILVGFYRWSGSTGRRATARRPAEPSYRRQTHDNATAGPRPDRYWCIFFRPAGNKFNYPATKVWSFGPADDMGGTQPHLA